MKKPRDLSTQERNIWTKGNTGGRKMYELYNEKCKGCPFEGKVSEPIKIGTLQGLRFIECLRDNDAAKEKFKQSGKEEDLQLWSSQEGNFLHCLYYYENANAFEEN